MLRRLTDQEHSRLGPVQAQLLPQSSLRLLVGAEGRPDGQPVHRHLLRAQAHLQGAAARKLRRHEAAVHIRVEPGVVTGCQVRHHRCEFHRLLQPLPASRNVAQVEGHCCFSEASMLLGPYVPMCSA